MRLEKERGDVLTLRGLDGRQGLRECLKDSGLQGDLICLTKGLSCSSDGKESPCNAGDLGSIPGSGSALDKEMATHSSILTWRIPQGIQPNRGAGGLPSMGLRRVRDD